jgi:dTDP-4-dehydrorhamnose 3,5-epimerase
VKLALSTLLQADFMTSSGFNVLSEPLPDVYLIRMPRFEDQRGFLLKSFHSEFFEALPNPFVPAEQFTSVSSTGVLRGMHFQEGYSAHRKLVNCLAGRLLDVVVDVRPESPNFNKPFSIELSGASPIAILIGIGYAHGFLSLAESSVMQYLTSSVHSPSNDKGVLWSSIDLAWPVIDPVISPRDAAHPQIGVERCTFL